MAVAVSAAVVVVSAVAVVVLVAEVLPSSRAPQTESWVCLILL